jgi:hypothetical protein
MSTTIEDFRVECGCYEFGTICYDEYGDYSHETNEECTI